MVICFDDCDSILDNDDAVNILKAALNSEKIRNIAWKSTKSTFDIGDMEKEEIESMIIDGKYPNNFDFFGKVIFITNRYYKKIDAAIQSRSMVIDITLKPEDVIKRIESILPNVLKDEKNITMAIKVEVLDFFKEIIAAGKLKKEMGIRNYLNAIKLKVSPATCNRWKHLAQNYS